MRSATKVLCGTGVSPAIAPTAHERSQTPEFWTLESPATNSFAAFAGETPASHKEQGLRISFIESWLVGPSHHWRSFQYPGSHRPCETAMM